MDNKRVLKINGKWVDNPSSLFWQRVRKLPVVVRATQIHEPFEVHTLEDVNGALHQGSSGDFLIQGIKGELYPCKPYIFRQTYETPEGWGWCHGCSTLIETSQLLAVPAALPADLADEKQALLCPACWAEKPDIEATP